MVLQTATPYSLLQLPSKEALCAAFVGKPLDALRTPAFIVDRATFAENCAKMHLTAKEWDATFRGHLKTHKTVEGTRLQLITKENRTDAVIVSTLMEAWQVIEGGLVEDGTVKDILYGLPIAPNKIGDVARMADTMAKYGGVLRVLVDHPGQVHSLEEYAKTEGTARRWSIFVKIDPGANRAGVTPGSVEFNELIKILSASSSISIYGFYAHSGKSYASTSQSEASSFLSVEIQSVNSAARLALDELSKSPSVCGVQKPFVLSVGSTPTAHAASAETRQRLAGELHGTLEIHAGNYPMLDLQQEHTSLISEPQIAQRVRATVVSLYPGRGVNGEDEALVDAGALAFSKDSGPSGGFGRVVGKPWKLARISQEHGILVRTGADHSGLELGQTVDIIGQHACLIAAGYPWYYVVDKSVDGGKTVVDVWVAWKGW